MSRQAKILGALAVTFVAAVVAADWAANFLWFDALGYPGVFWRLRLIKLGVFAVVLVLAFAYFWTNLRLLSTHLDVRSLVSAPGAPALASGASPGALSGALLVVAAALSLGYALSYAGDWDEVLRFAWARAYGEADPVLGHDLGFYLFTVPLLEAVQNGLLSASFITTAVLVWAYTVAGELRLHRAGIAAPAAVRRHVIANAVLFLLAFAGGYLLDRYALLWSADGVVKGAGYTDVHVRMPLLALATIVVVALAVLVTLPALWRNLRAALITVGTCLGLLFLGLWVTPPSVQGFVVEPNELEAETPFLEHNIRFTRRAFGLDAIDVRRHDAVLGLTPASIAANRETVDNVRLWDWRPLGRTFRQLQQIRTYYTFNDVDVDRYFVDGSYRQVMVAARELANDLPPRLETWVNERLQYTHGHGLAMSLAADKNEQGTPVLLVRDLPPQTRPGLAVPQPAIYYGEKMAGHRIVATAVREFDYPQGDDNVYSHYAGRGGVRLDAWWKRLLFAWHEFDINILLSEYVTAASRIQFRRPVRERVEQLAPFLRLDRDPYLVLGDEGLYWILDAYTLARTFPYAEPFDQDFNYIRNSVKVTVDAYHGDVRFYVMDEADPVLGVYRDAFPGLFHPVSQMPGDLRRHLRYPVDLFRAQIEVYNTYHVTRPQVFYNGEDLWTLPREKYGGEQIAMEPYYVLMKLPGEDRLQFLIMLPVTPHNRDNMIAWVAARCDYPGYGELVVYKLPKERLFLGPIQLEAMIDQDTLISEQLTLWDQRGSRVVRGNILVIPIDSAFIYVEPVYLIAEGTDIPQLKRVIVSDGQRVVMAESLAGAVRAVFGESPRAAPEPVAGEDPRGDLAGARAAFEQAEQALREGAWDRFGRAMETLKERLAE